MKKLSFIIFCLFLSCSATPRFATEVTEHEKMLFKDLKPSEDVILDFQSDKEYLIGSGDELKIDVYNQPELSSRSISISHFIGRVVDERGIINFPLVKQVKVAGLTRNQAKNLLEKNLSAYIKNPDVSLEVVRYNSQFYYITGGTSQNGKYPVTANSNILEAISRISASSLTSTDFMINTIYMKRDGKVLPISISEISRSNNDYTTVYLKDGDIFFVPSSAAERVYIVGEVLRPGAFRISKPDYTLMDLISEAGGLNATTADENDIYLVRQFGDSYKYIKLDYEYILSGNLSHNMTLNPNDRVIVAPKGITTYNRIIQQLLPTFQLLNSAAGVYGATK